jgi:predicted ATPase
MKLLSVTAGLAVGTRLNILGLEAKEIAQISAVIGREFKTELLSAVTTQPLEVVGSALQRLVNSQIVLPAAAPPIPSINDSVRQVHYRPWNFNAKLFRGLLIDHQLKPHRLLHRNIRRLCPF